MKDPFFSTPIKPIKATKKPMTLVAARKAKVTGAGAVAVAATSANANGNVSVSAPSTPAIQRTKVIPKTIKIPVATATYSSSGTDAHLMDDLSTAVESVEQEFASLNAQ
jgi:hypothetical protein